MLRELATFFCDLEGLVSEPVRATIVRRFCCLMADKLKHNGDEDAYRLWLSRDRGRFMRECAIKDGFQAVPDNLEIGPTDLSRFCDFWLKVSSFRTDPDKPWRPITPEMNSVRVTMIKQLRDIAEGKLDVDDLTEPE